LFSKLSLNLRRQPRRLWFLGVVFFSYLFFEVFKYTLTPQLSLVIPTPEEKTTTWGVSPQDTTKQDNKTTIPYLLPQTNKTWPAIHALSNQPDVLLLSERAKQNNM
jgi:hypothetical protein